MTANDASPYFANVLGNKHYRGHAFGWIFLVLMGAMNLFKGSIHLLKSDGGAGSIAGIDLSQNGEVILMLFAAAGLGQILIAAVDFAVGLRYRALVPVIVGYHLVHQVGAAVVVWWRRPLSLPAPGKYAAILLIPVALLAFWAATRRRDAVARALEARPKSGLASEATQ